MMMMMTVDLYSAYAELLYCAKTFHCVMAVILAYVTQSGSFLESTRLNQLKHDPYCLRPKCSLKILVLSIISFMTTNARFSLIFPDN